MTCHEINNLFPDYLTGQLAPESATVVETHLSECEPCRLELAEAREAWAALAQLPDQEPGPALRGRFYAMLDNEKRELTRSAGPSVAERLDGWMRSWWPRRPVAQFGLVLVVLVAGLAGGSKMRRAAPVNGELTRLEGEVQQMHQLVSMSMLKQSSSSERLRGVNLSAEVDSPSPSLMSALINTLNCDPNVSVRLASVDALMLFSDQPGVLDKLVQSLAHQDSPLIQVAIIDLLISMKEQKSLQALRELIQVQDVNPEVKKHAENKLRDVT